MLHSQLQAQESVPLRHGSPGLHDSDPIVDSQPYRAKLSVGIFATSRQPTSIKKARSHVGSNISKLSLSRTKAATNNDDGTTIRRESPVKKSDVGEAQEQAPSLHDLGEKSRARLTTSDPGDAFEFVPQSPPAKRGNVQRFFAATKEKASVPKTNEAKEPLKPTTRAQKATAPEKPIVPLKKTRLDAILATQQSQQTSPPENILTVAKDPPVENQKHVHVTPAKKPVAPPQKNHPAPVAMQSTFEGRRTPHVTPAKKPATPGPRDPSVFEFEHGKNQACDAFKLGAAQCAVGHVYYDKNNY
jgi:hypothetical protein